MNTPRHSLTSVESAMATLLDAARARPLAHECVPVGESVGRVLAQDLAARRDQPPLAIAAMDGYALRAADSDPPGQTLAIIGESAAGHAFAGAMGAGQCVRIFTGAAIPLGADCVLMQEHARLEDGMMSPESALAPGRHIRPKASDFAAGDVLLKTGTRLSPSALALAASMNHPVLDVARRPRVAVLASGDELALPGTSEDPDVIIASNTFAINAMARLAGGETRDLGIARDTRDSLMAAFQAAQDWEADVLVTIGGASVGNHDLVRHVAADLGAAQSFYKLAMRPGKPLNFGALGPMLLLGLPGNPVSSIVCAQLFLMPLIAALQGDTQAGQTPSEPALLGRDLPENDERQDYLRASLHRDAQGLLIATPFASQDSARLGLLAHADCLVIRPPFAPAARAGASCTILKL